MKDASVIIEPDFIDVEEIILSELRTGTKKPAELTKIWTDNPRISKNKYYRALKHLKKIQRIDEYEKKGNRPKWYGLNQQPTIDYRKINFIIQEMILASNEPESLILGLNKLKSITRYGRTAWYFSDIIPLKNGIINNFLELLQNSSSEIRILMVDILSYIINIEPHGTTWRDNFEELIKNKMICIVKNDCDVEIQKKALNLVGMIDPELSCELAIILIKNTTLTKEQFGKLEQQINIELFDSQWARNNKLENTQKLFNLYKTYIKEDDDLDVNEKIIRERLYDIIKTNPII